MKTLGLFAKTAPIAICMYVAALGGLAHAVDSGGLASTDLERVYAGSSARDLALEDEKRHEITLSRLREQKNVVRVIYRGHCTGQPVGLRNGFLDETRCFSTPLLAVSIDIHSASEKLIQLIPEDGSKVTFPLLEDIGQAVIDKHGFVRWKFVEVDYATRPANEIVLTAMKALQ